MEITRQPSGDLLVLHLSGRLDANWCNTVQDALAAAVRDGQHRLYLNMAQVSYLSSAGIRVLLTFYKQLGAINGLFGVVNPSDMVRSVLELSGLQRLIAAAASSNTQVSDKGREHASGQASYEVFTTGTPSGMRVQMTGDVSRLRGGSNAADLAAMKFGNGTFGLGVGALGRNTTENTARFGEFLAVAGSAAFQPADGSSRADYMVSEGALVPEGTSLLGLSGEGTFGTLARFEAAGDARTVGLAELAQNALEFSGGDAVAMAAITETAGLVGATLRQSPASQTDTQDRFAFPQIRDWLSYTSERAHRDSTSLIVGVVAKAGSPLAPLLRPLARDHALLGHFHAAAFPYRPLRKGRIDLQPSVADLFEGQSLQAVMHLLADSRGITGAGESEFYRGALWLSPVTSL